MKAGSGIALGLLLAFVAQLLAFAMMGAGHGWIAPFYASLLLWIFLPLTFAIASPFGRFRQGRRRRLLMIILIGLIADVALVVATIQEGVDYFWTAMKLGGAFVIPWLLIWISWQLVAALALARGRGDYGE